jgi:N-methylhydantoinase A
MGVSVGIDVGGTFTDLVMHDSRDDRLVVGKVLSTAPDPTDGVLTGFALLLETGVDVEAIEYVAHASTVASNLVIERNAGRTALITSQGFRDVLHIQRQKRADLYDLFYDKPTPVVARRDIFEVRERTLFDGTILVPLDEDDVRDCLRTIAAAGIESVAVVLLHSYANPAPEQRIRDIAREEAEGLYVSLSSEVSPKWREYERASTTSLNAYVAPSVVRYLERMSSELRDRGVKEPIHVMQCSGGMITTEAIERTAVSLIESGPAAGALAAAFIGHSCGRDRIVAFDMGGTTAKVSIVEAGEPHIVDDFEIAPTTKLRPGSGLPVTVPAVDLVEIGTGGGSIAHLEAGVLGVGPASAGASPGPACYGLGGMLPTVTDANLVLGYLDPGYFLGGQLTLDVEKAEVAVREHIAQPLGLSVEEAAFAIHALANAGMANAMRVMTVQRGFDPRHFSAIAFGGAGPTHIAGLARDVGFREAIVPPNAGVASALGLLVAPIRVEFARTLRTRLRHDLATEITEVLEGLEARANEALSRSRVSEHDMTFRRFARMRYVGQGFEISVPMPSGSISAEKIDETAGEFRRTYETLYGYADPEGDLEIVDWRVTGLGPSRRDRISHPAHEGGASGAFASTRPAYFRELEGYVDTAIHSRYDLPVGHELEGPAIIQERESTTLIPPGVSGVVDALGNIALTMPESGLLQTIGATAVDVPRNSE